MEPSFSHRAESSMLTIFVLPLELLHHLDIIHIPFNIFMPQCKDFTITSSYSPVIYNVIVVHGEGDDFDCGYSLGGFTDSFVYMTESAMAETFGYSLAGPDF